MKICKLEVYRIEGDHQSVRKRWHAMGDAVQGIVNCIWETWLCWHVANGTAAKQRNFLDTFAAWKKAGKQGDKPKSDTVAVSPTLGKLIRKRLKEDFPHVASRVRELVQQSTIKKISQRKAAKGSLPGWVAILFRNESIPSSTRSQPIPFDCQNCEVIPPEKPGDRFRLALRVDRFTTAGKTQGESHVDVVELLTNRKGISQYEAVMRRIAAGETGWKFKGSNLVWDKGNKKWFVHLAYEMPEAEKPELDASKTATLLPCRNDPWALFFEDGNWQWFGGRGRHIAAARVRLLTSRWSRQENYRFAGSSNKGHGRKRALLPIEKLSEGWKDFVKTCNNVVTHKVVKACVARGIGTLIYLQPCGDKRDSRFLTTAGKVPGRHDSTGWDWHQVATQLEQKCKEAGIKFITKQVGGDATKEAA